MNKQKKCPKCKQKILPSGEEIQICTYCGYADSENLPPFDEIMELPPEDQYNSHSNVQRLGKLALIVLLLLLFVLSQS